VTNNPLTPTGTQKPLRHDAVTMICPIDQRRFTPVGRQKFCSDACRAAAYRRRHKPTTSLVVPKAQPRRPITIYECDTCGARALGDQRCEECRTFMRKVGIGGTCPHCDEPVALADLVGPDLITTD
jgi:hypothetical protein